MVQDESVDAVRVIGLRERSQQFHDTGLRGFLLGQQRPLTIEPFAQPLAFFRSLRRINEVERVARSEAQSVGAEREGAMHSLTRTPVAVTQDHGALRDGAAGSADLGCPFDPFRTSDGQGAALESVTRGAVRGGPEEAEFHVVWRQNETHVRHSGQLVGKFPKCMEG